MKIEDFTNMDEFHAIMGNWATATGLATVAVGMDGKYISDCYNFTDFCIKYTRGSAEGARRCLKCDMEGKGVYHCHAGLVDFGFPIMVDGEQLGNVLGGQVLPENPDEEKFRQIAREINVNEDDYIRALHQVNVRTQESIDASANLLNQAINNFVTASYHQHKDKDIIDRLREGVKANNELTKNVNGKIADLRRIQAEQRILALNAKLEAARAGAAGEGFSVVAGEVGRLSDICAETYGEIEGTVKKMSETMANMQKGL